MNSKIKIAFSLIGGILIFVAFTGALAFCLAEEPQAAEPDGNNKCYVCHPGLKTEDISTIHLDMGVTCDECHGPSVEHMHDEMLMTKPDLLFGRSEVKRMCSNPTCHKPGTGREVYSRHDHRDPAAIEAFLKKWLGRIRPNGRAVTHDSVCTDCHGTHNITKPTGTKSEEEAAEWITAFNGRDLTGWRTSGGASWGVKAGRIEATAGASGQGGTLWTETTYENYLLAITFRASWPIRAGIWVHGTDSENGPRIEIFDSNTAFTGSVMVPGKGLVLVNLREDLVDRESWNTISVKVEDDRIQVWLNGEEIGAVRAASPVKGKIGLFIEKHPGSKSAELFIREVLVRST